MVRLDTKIKYILAAAAVILLAAITALSSGAQFARAAASSYSDVLDDLRKDSSFNVDDFPALDDDYRIYLIQIAEGEKGDLFVYTYQPCQLSRPLTATHLNMSLTDNVNDTELYGLTLLNETGVFVKYRVQGVTVRSNTSLRYYNISSIYRNYIEGIDDKPNSNNNVSEKAFPVGKLFYVMTQQNGSIAYNLDPKFVVQIINPVSSYITVENSDTGINTGLGLWNNYRKWQYTDLHYVAFSTDWDIDRLISATVHYSYCSGVVEDYDWLWWNVKDSVKYGEPDETTVNLECTESYDVTHKNLWSVFTLGKHTYTWDKIYSVNDFCADVGKNTSYDEGTLNAVRDTVAGREWVLMFSATERKVEKDSSLGFIYYDTYFTKVDEVTVLRLEFESDGIVYNLGAVSDKVSNSTYPEPTDTNNPDDGEQGFFEYLWHCIKAFFTGTATVKETVIAVAALLVGLVLVCVLGYIITALISIFVPALRPVLRSILNKVVWLVLKLVQGVLWLLLLLPRGIIALFKAIGNARALRKATAATADKPRKTKRRSKKK